MRYELGTITDRYITLVSEDGKITRFGVRNFLRYEHGDKEVSRYAIVLDDKTAGEFYALAKELEKRGFKLLVDYDFRELIAVEEEDAGPSLII